MTASGGEPKGFDDKGALAKIGGRGAVFLPASVLAERYWLSKARPDLCARSLLWIHAPLLIVLSFAVLAVGYVARFAPEPQFLFITVWVLQLAMPLLMLPALIRTDLLVDIADSTIAQGNDLPFYGILLPLYNEANMLVQIRAALLRLNYPRDRMVALILLEADDRRTRAAALAMDWPDFVKIIVLPDGEPRTKARACNIGKEYATDRYGCEFVVVYDAEDRPHPDQLREAVHMFATHGENLACVQAVLQITPNRSSWLERQFQLEYQILFGNILPSLNALNLPLPLSGTSNHFRVSALEKIGGWDDYNLTEDADLGFRFYRFGYTVKLLARPTIENAPQTFRIWFHQRVRWIMGYLQTAMVISRNPRATINARATINESGLIAFIVMLVLMAGRGLSGIIHTGFVLALYFSPAMRAYLLANPLILILVSATYVFLSVVAFVAAPNKRAALPIIVTQIVYWLLLAPPALWAVIRLINRNLHWNKTPHIPYAE